MPRLVGDIDPERGRLSRTTLLAALAISKVSSSFDAGVPKMALLNARAAKTGAGVSG